MVSNSPLNFNSFIKSEKLCREIQLNILLKFSGKN